MKKIIMLLIALIIIGSVAAYGLQVRNAERATALSQRLLAAQVQQENSEVEEIASVEASSTTVETGTTQQASKGSATTTTPKAKKVVATKEALLADGCFWCVQHDLQELAGVLKVVSGYAGGTNDNPTYENYAEYGHREVVLVSYDANKVSYANLVEHIIKHGDPSDANGSFHDRGPQYAPAIYFASEEEKIAAHKVISEIDALHVFEKPLPLVVIPTVKFWPAEEYHQDYGNKNPLRYSYYRSGSGRDAFIKAHWGEKADELTVSGNVVQTGKVKSAVGVNQQMPWKSYVKPSDSELRKLLTPLQYSVSQQSGTEPPHDNLYDNNFADGIYVDILSGEPLYSSRDKFDSGTGWPSFVSPITNDAVVLKDDNTLFHTRTEVRSRYADDHLGHVFPDGPVERGGLRYCMNSASMRFVPKAEMEKEGYGYLLSAL